MEDLTGENVVSDSWIPFDPDEPYDFATSVLDSINIPSFSSAEVPHVEEDEEPQDKKPSKTNKKKQNTKEKEEKEAEKQKIKDEKQKQKEEKEWERVRLQQEKEEKRRRKEEEEEEVNEEILEKEELLRKIALYYQYFPLIKTARKFSIQSKIHILDNELRRCQQAIKSDAALENVKRFDIMICALMETFLCNYLPLQGLKSEAEKTQDIFINEYKELSIEYEYLFSCGPEFRYVVKFIQRMMTVMEINHKLKYGIDQPQNYQDVSQDKKEKYKDY